MALSVPCQRACIHDAHHRALRNAGLERARFGDPAEAAGIVGCGVTRFGVGGNGKRQRGHAGKQGAQTSSLAGNMTLL